MLSNKINKFEIPKLGLIGIYRLFLKHESLKLSFFYWNK